jgi:hypothetical protein
MHLGGSGAAAEPNAIIASSNLTTTCLTCVTLPCGETLVMRAASARHVDALSRPSAATVAHIHFRLRVPLRIDHAPVAYRMLAILPDDHQYPQPC